MNRLLLGPETAFVLVTSPRYQARRESEWLLNELDRARIHREIRDWIAARA